MKRIIIAALAIAAMVGCTKDLDELNGSFNNAVSFAIGDIIETRAAIKSSWSEDGTDRIGIYTTDGDYANVEYSVGTGGVLSPVANGETIYYTSQDDMTFYAYYPFDSETAGTEVSVDVSDQSKSIDLLVSDQVIDKQSTSQGVKFSFSHALSAVEITINDSDMVEIDMSTLTLYTEEIITEATYDLEATSNNVALGEQTNEITFELSVNADGSYIAQAILIPSDYSATKVYFSFKDTSEVPYRYELVLGKEYVSGYKYTYDAKIGVDYVTFTADDELAWGDSTTAEGVMEYLTLPAQKVGKF